MSNHTEHIGFTTNPAWIIFRQKTVKKLSFFLTAHTDGHFFLTADMDSCSSDVVKEFYDDGDEFVYFVYFLYIYLSIMFPQRHVLN